MKVKILITMTMMWTVSIFAETKNSTNSVQVMMQDKLSHSQMILKGMTTENFDLILQNTKLLGLISKATVWHKSDNEDFRRHAANFQESVNFMEEQAKNKNLEGVTMGYMRLVFNCLHCHNLVRQKKK